MRAVIYARYSSSSQREESIEGQVKECAAYAERNGYTVIKTYADRAISGTTDNRPQFQKMIEDSKRKPFDFIIVWKLDRFARNRYDSAKYKAQLKKLGIKVISATEAISSGADGILLESLLEGMAEWYSEDLKEKVVRGLSINAEKCKWNGGTLPLGYIVDEESTFSPTPKRLLSFWKLSRCMTRAELSPRFGTTSIPRVSPIPRASPSTMAPSSVCFLIVGILVNTLSVKSLSRMAFPLWYPKTFLTVSRSGLPRTARHQPEPRPMKPIS